MNSCAIVRPRAEADLQDAWIWYESQRPGLGGEFLAEIHTAIRSLEMDPERRPVYYRDFRRMLTRRFPYKIFYRTEGHRVVIFRVLHVKREHRWHLKG